ncbi:MAG: hypothetical protein RLZZ417_3143 [Bacteroidota bacterium]
MSDRLNKLLDLLQESPTDSFILFAVAKEFENLNQQDVALRYYEKLYALNSTYVGLYYHWGKILEDLDQISKALEVYTLGIDISLKLKDTHAEKELRAAKYNCEMLQ